MRALRACICALARAAISVTCAVAILLPICVDDVAGQTVIGRWAGTSSDYRGHSHIQNARTRHHGRTLSQGYAAVVGTVETGSERPITGRSGDHLQFYIDAGAGARYQVDVNTQSRDGTDVLVHIADEALDESGSANPSQPFGAPDYGVSSDAQLSYKAMGLKDGDFTPLSYSRIEARLETALNAAAFVAVYGMTFDDGGRNGKGVHDIHFNPGKTNRDGALAIYSQDAGTGKPRRTWFFFKFQGETIR